MRIVAFLDTGASIRFGVEQAGQVAPIQGVGRFDDLAPLLMAAKPLGLEASRPLADLVLLPPVPYPGKVVCIGLNYRLHAQEGGHDIPTYPAVFMRTAHSMVGPGMPLVAPTISTSFDYEAELAAVIGRTAIRVSRADALSHVAGYCCANDGSLRDFQRKSSQWTMGKNFDASGALGPALVTPDELPPGAAGLRIQCRLNGDTVQDSQTGDMIFDVAELIETVSAVMTLDVGDVIITGTPSGVGYARKPPLWMKAGDVCEIEIEGIGILRNPVIAA